MAQIANIAGVHPRGKGREETEAGNRRQAACHTAQAAKMLNVSKRTMQRMRTDHRIEYVVVRGKLPLPPFRDDCGYWRTTQ